jgi:hypothetical protein
VSQMTGLMTELNGLRERREMTWSEREHGWVGTPEDPGALAGDGTTSASEYRDEPDCRPAAAYGGSQPAHGRGGVIWVTRPAGTLETFRSMESRWHDQVGAGRGGGRAGLTRRAGRAPTGGATKARCRRAHGRSSGAFLRRRPSAPLDQGQGGVRSRQTSLVPRTDPLSWKECAAHSDLTSVRHVCRLPVLAIAAAAPVPSILLLPRTLPGRPPAPVGSPRTPDLVKTSVAQVLAIVQSDADEGRGAPRCAGRQRCSISTRWDAGRWGSIRAVPGGTGGVRPPSRTSSSGRTPPLSNYVSRRSPSRASPWRPVGAGPLAPDPRPSGDRDRVPPAAERGRWAYLRRRGGRREPGLQLSEPVQPDHPGVRVAGPMDGCGIARRVRCRATQGP